MFPVYLSIDKDGRPMLSADAMDAARAVRGDERQARMRKNGES
jgi:hypothetical protein